LWNTSSAAITTQAVAAVAAIAACEFSARAIDGAGRAH
jgi:hypothetical protein